MFLINKINYFENKNIPYPFNNAYYYFITVIVSSFRSMLPVVFETLYIQVHIQTTL